MAATFDDVLLKRSREIALVFGILLHIQHAVLRAVYGNHRQTRRTEIRGGIRRQQDKTIIGRGVFRCVARRHAAAQRVSADVPVPDLRVLLRDAVGSVHIQHRQIQRHPDQHAKHAAVGQRTHQRRIGGVLHLAAGIEDHAGFRVLGNKGEGVPLLLYGHICGRAHCCHSNIVRVIEIRSISPAYAAQKQHSYSAKLQTLVILHTSHALFDPRSALYHERADGTMSSNSAYTPDDSPSYSGRFPQIVQSGCIFAVPSPILRKNLRFRASKKPEGNEPTPAK